MRILLLAALMGCAPPPRAELAWTFEARVTTGEVRVLPIVALHEAPPLSLETYVGRDVAWGWEGIRRARTAELRTIPDAIGVELPAAVNGVLGTRWAGQFRSGGWPLGARDRVAAALSGKRPVDETLSEVAGRVRADASLFLWILDLQGRPVSADEFPDCILLTPCGPVLVDPSDESYLVDAKVGVALVARDGEVVLRYTDVFQAILGRAGAARAARDLARDLAEEIGKVWAVEDILADDG